MSIYRNFFLWLPLFLWGFDDCAIVFVYTGKVLPDYVETALLQARNFNPSCPIVLIANEGALKKFHFTSHATITFIACESLKKSTEHEQFLEKNQWREGLWRASSERFFYLHDYMQQHHVKNVFHMECDNMLYVDVRELLPILLDKYQGIAATFDNDERGIGGFIFIPNSHVSHILNSAFLELASKRKKDMEVLAWCKDKYGYEVIDHLPIIMNGYLKEHTLKTSSGKTTKYPEKFVQHADLFCAIFDAAAIGQYLGGIDPIHGKKPTIGFINESCLFNPSYLHFTWMRDAQGRKVPYAEYAGHTYRINNLHIHSKNLKAFYSRNK